MTALWNVWHRSDYICYCFFKPARWVSAYNLMPKKQEMGIKIIDKSRSIV